ncbi:MAG: Holliday junction resolvase RuvX [Flavobacteriaceae bacterium]|jgi:putative Holliday junction resolvase
MSRILALDYGTKRTGIAVTDPLQMIASGLCTVNTPELMTFLQQYFAEESVACVVLGAPRRWDNTTGPIEEEIQSFIKRFQSIFPLMPLDRQDERFTSMMAQQAMIDGGLKKSKRQDKALVDQISATLILQSYLTKKR